MPSISYPSLDDSQPPPAYEDSAVGQLIDLGTEIPAPSQQGDIVSQLAELGVTTTPGETAQAKPPESQDEFDMFAKSRTAYAQG